MLILGNELESLSPIATGSLHAAAMEEVLSKVFVSG